ncbi:hypothetical protein FS749_007453, partial [Ceratobasidium sp. UAMH 11750]
LGRSSGAGSFSIWTHQLKGVNFTDSFVPTGCSRNVPGVSAVTLGAAEQWRDVYQAVDERNRTIVGGAANTVGAAGGYVQGGGHGPLGSLYGMAVDNVLQFTIVKPDGKVVKANACQNKDLFWALRGGGGGTWGVTLDVTYKTHPPLDSIVGMGITINVTNSEQFRDFGETFLRALPGLTDQGIRGYVWVAQFTFTLAVLHPNSPSLEHTNQTLAPIWDWITNHSDTRSTSFGLVHPTFFDLFKLWLNTDLGIVQPTWMGRGLFPERRWRSGRESWLSFWKGMERMLWPVYSSWAAGRLARLTPSQQDLTPSGRTAHWLAGTLVVTRWAIHPPIPSDISNLQSRILHSLSERSLD